MPASFFSTIEILLHVVKVKQNRKKDTFLKKTKKNNKKETHSPFLNLQDVVEFTLEWKKQIDNEFFSFVHFNR